LSFPGSYCHFLIEPQLNVVQEDFGHCWSQCQKCRRFVSPPVCQSISQSPPSKIEDTHTYCIRTHTQTQTLAIFVAVFVVAFLRASKNKATLKMLMPSARPNDRPIDTDIDRCPQTSKTNARLPSHRYSHAAPKHTHRYSIGDTHANMSPK